jgi:hypothetical protein
MNVLLQVHSGKIEIARRGRTLEVAYLLRFTELVIFALSTAAALAAFCLILPAFSTSGAVAILAFGWLWLFGANYLIAGFRIPNALRQLARRTVGGTIS